MFAAKKNHENCHVQLLVVLFKKIEQEAKLSVR